MLKILGRKTSGNTQKVLWCCDELSLAYEREDYGRGFGNNHEPAYLALNPNGRVPTIVDDGFVLWESNAIVRYLCARHGMGTLCSPELERRADMERWMDWQQTTLRPRFHALYDALAEDKKALAEAFQLKEPIDYAQIREQTKEYAERIRPLVCDTAVYLADAMARGATPSAVVVPGWDWGWPSEPSPKRPSKTCDLSSW